MVNCFRVYRVGEEDLDRDRVGHDIHKRTDDSRKRVGKIRASDNDIHVYAYPINPSVSH